MLSTWIGIGLLAILLIWLLGFGRRRPEPSPEDDVDTPIARDELAEAEAAVKDDPDAAAAADVVDDDEDDWGPGSGHSPMPGILP